MGGAAPCPHAQAHVPHQQQGYSGARYQMLRRASRTRSALMAAAGLLGGGRLNAASASAWPIMLYLGSLSAVAYMLWSLLLQYHPVSRIMVFTFLNPVFGVLLSALLLNELKTLNVPRCLFAMLLVCLGVWIVNRPEKLSRAG